ncbi:cytochrome P450 [Allorhizocola rhizosphaerae]|uniref:cytochrome P450 n=1 Tax=Allorhizocola rhizosphaerae TaxID=1872709 RepID=UPI000E3CA06B|nr:cytochrome P450 [Allorhizocola rhizosphaerae]
MTRQFSGPPVWAAFRQLRLMARDRLTMMTEAAAHGDAVRLPVGHKVLYLFNHPEHARHVLTEHSANYHKGIGLVHARRALGDGLLTSEGELWRKQRKVIAPAFAGKHISRQAAVIAQEAEKLIEELRRCAGRGPVDVLAALTQLTLGVLGRTLLDADLRAFASIGRSFTAIQDQAMFELVTLSAVPMWIPLPRQLRFRRARRDLERIVDRLVAQRSAAGPDGDDVLTRLIESAGSEPDPRVGRQRLRDELVTLLLAGHETTASTLGWSLYLIDRHPDVRQRLHDEAVEVLGDRRPTHEDLRRLTYTGMVIQEAMRLYPPVWMLPRKAIAADSIAGYRVPAGADVLICPYTLHRRPDMWPEPQRFEPERFAADRSSERSRFAYLPFGSGPRVCVGSHLGMAEATIVLAMIARELRLSTVPGYPVVAEPMLSLRVRGGLPMSVHTLT